MRSISKWALVSMLLVVLAACSTGPTTRVLFIGNSYTFSNDLPGMVRDLAADAGHKMDVEVRAPGGWWWRDHVDSSETLDLIVDGEFDHVVLQEQSMVTAASDMASLHSRPAAVTLANRAVGSGANVVMFMTWAHREGSSEVGHSNYSSMQIAVANTYSEIGSAVLGDVAPIGMAWWVTRAERPGIELYQADGSHPSEEGSYLAAVVLAATILDIDVGEFESPLGLDEETAEVLREFAARAVDGEVPWQR